MKNNRRLISVNSAKKKMISSLKDYKNTSEFIDFKDSENRVLANNIVSKNNIPEFDKLLHEAVDSLPVVLPANKTSLGITVNSKFQLPIILKSN